MTITIDSMAASAIETLDLDDKLRARALDALEHYYARTAGTPDCFDSWSDESLIVRGDGSVVSVGELARQYLNMAGVWWEAVKRLAGDLTHESALSLPDVLNPLVTAEARDALAARDKVLVSWARLTLGTAGPTPQDLGGYVETDETCIYLR